MTFMWDDKLKHRLGSSHGRKDLAEEKTNISRDASPLAGVANKRGSKLSLSLSRSPFLCSNGHCAGIFFAAMDSAVQE